MPTQQGDGAPTLGRHPWPRESWPSMCKSEGVRYDPVDGVREETFSEAYKKHNSVTHTEAREKIDKACKG